MHGLNKLHITPYYVNGKEGGCITTSDDVEGSLVPRRLLLLLMGLVKDVCRNAGDCCTAHIVKGMAGGLGGRLRGEIPRQGCGSQRLHQHPRVPDGVPRRDAGPLPGCLHDREDSCFHPCTNVDSRVDMKEDRVDKAQAQAQRSVGCSVLSRHLQYMVKPLHLLMKVLRSAPWTWNVTLKSAPAVRFCPCPPAPTLPAPSHLSIIHGVIHVKNQYFHGKAAAGCSCGASTAPAGPS